MIKFNTQCREMFYILMLRPLIAKMANGQQ